MAKKWIFFLMIHLHNIFRVATKHKKESIFLHFLKQVIFLKIFSIETIKASILMRCQFYFQSLWRY